MGRVIFRKGQQSVWLKNILRDTHLTKEDFAKFCGVHERTVREWLRETYTIPTHILPKITNQFHIARPQNITELADYWYIERGAKKGARKRLELYGPPGTSEGRSKGGKISQQRRKENPEKYRLLGCNVRKYFPSLIKSEELAESVGIILGDGGITHYQLVVYLDRKTDVEYAKYVGKLFTEVFGENPKIYNDQKNATLELILSGANLIDNLRKIGLEKGNKIKKQVNFPKWIWEKEEYQIACVRGLMDTDGGLYLHNHKIKGINYRNLGLCFTSWSKPLLQSVSRVLKKYNLRFSLNNNQRIYMYSLTEIKKYFEIFGTSSPKLTEKFETHIKKIATIKN